MMLFVVKTAQGVNGEANVAAPYVPACPTDQRQVQALVPTDQVANRPGSMAKQSCEHA